MSTGEGAAYQPHWVAGPESSRLDLRVLVVNFQMDPGSQVLGWQERVAGGLAERLRSVTVLTEHAVSAVRPPNLSVFTVPRWMQRPWRWTGAKWLMNSPVWRLVRAGDIDVCFIHMAAEWAYRLFPTLRALGVPIVLWYAHGTVTNRLRLALRCADRVLTSSAEGFRLASPKVHVIGQGVDIDRFGLLPSPATPDRIVTVGRLSPRKRIEVIIRALAEIRRHPEARDVTLRVIGGPATRADRRYADELRAEALRLGLDGAVEFTGPLSAAEVARRHADAFLHVNVSATGSMDKSVLEALACGRPVLTSNEAYRTLLPDLMVDAAEPARLAARVLDLRRQRSTYRPEAMRARVVGRHDFRGYVERVISHLAEVRAT